MSMPPELMEYLLKIQRASQQPGAEYVMSPQSQDMMSGRAPLPTQVPENAQESFGSRLQGLLGSGFDDPRTQGLLGLGSALLQASGPSPVPISTGQALGQGINAYTKGRIGKQGFDTDQRLKEAKTHRLMNPAIGQGPASIQEWMYYSKLSPEDQKRFLEVKRNPNVLNFGDSLALLGPGGSQTKLGDVRLKPGERPEVRGAQTTAVKEAENAASLDLDKTKKSIKASDVLEYIDKAEDLLGKATGSYLGAGLQLGKRAVGYSDDTTKANQQLKLISGWMVSNVPRMEGPQSNYDVENYKTMAGMVGDSTVPIEDRRAALKTLRELQAKYLPQQPAPNANATKPTSNVRVVDW